MARAMLLDADLSSFFWPFAITTAVYLKNRLPHSALPSHVTPYERWFGSKPDLSHLRPFGAFCSSRIVNTPTSKLQPRGEAGRLLGYALESKAYLFWHTATRSVKVRRDLAFHGPPSPRIGQRGVELDVYQDIWNSKLSEHSEHIENEQQGSIYCMRPLRGEFDRYQRIYTR